jgi:RHS repeat-associated protein
LRHEITYLPDGSRHERTFVAEEQDDVVPLGHRDDGGEWRFYVGDVNGAPQELVDAAGNQVGALTRNAFGRVLRLEGATTDVRAPAQIEDEETGLYYNRYRYYDPEIGRFISPDPIGLEGGLNEYAYGPNPVAWFDAMGWAHRLTVSDCDIEGVPRAEPNYKESQSYADRGEYPSGMRSKKGGGNDRNCPKELNNRAECHSERKLLNDLEHARKAHAAKPENKDVPLGGKVTANGQYPPCPQCHRAMLKFAQENGTKITYKWGSGKEEQAITYAPEGKPAFDGKSAKKLEKGYTLDPNKDDDKYGKEFQDGSAAAKAYQKQKRASDAYKQQQKKKKKT